MDIDQSLGKCLGTGLAAYPNLEVLALRELNVYDEAVSRVEGGREGGRVNKKGSLSSVNSPPLGTDEEYMWGSWYQRECSLNPLSLMPCRPYSTAIDALPALLYCH